MNKSETTYSSWKLRSFTAAFRFTYFMVHQIYIRWKIICKIVFPHWEDVWACSAAQSCESTIHTLSYQRKKKMRVGVFSLVQNVGNILWISLSRKEQNNVLVCWKHASEVNKRIASSAVLSLQGSGCRQNGGRNVHLHILCFWHWWYETGWKLAKLPFESNTNSYFCHLVRKISSNKHDANFWICQKEPEIQEQLQHVLGSTHWEHLAHWALIMKRLHLKRLDSSKLLGSSSTNKAGLEESINPAGPPFKTNWLIVFD